MKVTDKGVKRFAGKCISQLWLSILERRPCYGYGVADINAWR